MTIERTKLRIAMLGTRGMPTTYGGVERAVEEVSVRLAERGHDVTVYCRTPYCVSREPIYRGVSLRYLPAVNTKHLEALSHTALATLDAVAKRFDVIHYNALGPSLLAPLARASGAKVICTVQGLDYERQKWGGFAKLVLRAGGWSAVHAAHKTVVVSETLRDHFRGVYGRDAVYAPNGIDVPESVEAPLPPFDLESGSYFLFLGRLVPEKGVDELIRAYRAVDATRDLVIAGPSSHTDSYVAELEQEAAKDPRVRLIGPVYGSAKESLIAHCFAFCQPSTLEGLPFAMLEAASYGRPIVMSDLPEHREIVGDAGFAFRRGDERDLARVLGEVLRTGDLGRRGAYGRDRVIERYGWNAIVDRIEAAYFDACGLSSGRVHPNPASTPLP